MIPMVFSATAFSMPAFTASRPISSSILPRLDRLLCRILDCEFILILCETNYKRSAPWKARFSFIAREVLQQCKSEHGIPAGMLHRARRLPPRLEKSMRAMDGGLRRVCGTVSAGLQ